MLLRCYNSTLFWCGTVPTFTPVFFCGFRTVSPELKSYALGVLFLLLRLIGEHFNPFSSSTLASVTPPSRAQDNISVFPRSCSLCPFNVLRPPADLPGDRSITLDKLKFASLSVQIESQPELKLLCFCPFDFLSVLHPLLLQVSSLPP